jgi:putative ABC transport system permease protein
MEWIRVLLSRFMSLSRRKELDVRLDEELRAHIDLAIAEHVRRGMTEGEARTAALRDFGGVTQTRERYRVQRGLPWLAQIARDLRYGWRTLQRTPGFTTTAIIVMALGIGANVAIFSIVRTVLLNPLPYRDPQQLVALYSHSSIARHQFAPIDAGSFFAWQQAAQGMAEMALISPFQNYNVSAEGNQLPEKVDAAWVTANFFSTLGVQPAMGRGFSESDDRPAAGATAILSNSFWKRRYGADPNVVGRKIWLDARPYTIIGVMPESLIFLGPFSSGKIQVWTPASHEASPFLMSTFEDHEFIAVARLAQGVTLPQLLGRLDPIQAQIKAQHPAISVRSVVSGRSLLDDAVQDYKTPLYVLFAATGCVLLIACLNVAGLLVARAAARRKEHAIRTALGGGLMRLVRERVMESLLLSAGGGLLGVMLAAAALRWLEHVRPDMRRVEGIHLDWTAAVFTAGVVILCAVFSGFISSISVDSRRILSALQDGSRTQAGTRGHAGLRQALLVLEISLTVVLLIGAGLLLKSYSHLRSTNLGVPVHNVLTMQVGLPDARYKTTVEQVSFFERLIERVRAIPGVESAGLVSTAPGQGWGGDRIVMVVEHPPLPKDGETDMMVRGTDPGYFSAMNIPILKGRTFASDERLHKDHVVLISQQAAKICFPGEDPIGKHLKVSLTGDIYEIIGVVGDTRYSISDPSLPMMYMPVFGNGFTNVTIVLRSAHDVDMLAMPVEKLISQLDRDLPVSGVMTLEESMAKATLGSQFDSLLVLGFAVIALVLAAVGHYGVLAYLVTQQTSEIGIRIALGAQRGQILRKILFDGVRPALAGIAAGLLVSAAVVRLIESMLYETEPLDPSIFAAVAGVFLIVAVAACLMPAWRAARLDPVQALRGE